MGFGEFGGLGVYGLGFGVSGFRGLGFGGFGVSSRSCLAGDLFRGFGFRFRVGGLGFRVRSCLAGDWGLRRLLMVSGDLG